MLTLSVEGMTCGHCVRAVTQAIQSIDAGARVDVNLAMKQVQVETRLDAALVMKALREAGYEPALVC